MSRLTPLAVAGVTALVVAGCGDSSQAPGSSGSSADPGGGAADVQPAVVTDIGGRGDRGFNDLAIAGLERAEEEFGLDGRVLVPETPADYANNLDQLARNGASPVFAVGFSLADAVQTTAEEYPDTEFGLVDSVVDLPNVRSLVFREEEGSYLAGVTAGLMTQEATDYTTPDDSVVGFIGGQDAPLIEKFGAGFEQGVASVCPDCTVLYQYVGTSTDAFSNPAVAAEIARSMHSQGADVIYHAAGSSGDGLFKVATDENFFAIGVNTDQAVSNEQAPILTSMLKRVDNAVYETVADAVEGSAASGTVTYGLDNDGVGLAGFGRFEPVVPQQVTDAVSQATEQIISGEVTVATSRSGEDG